MELEVSSYYWRHSATCRYDERDKYNQVPFQLILILLSSHVGLALGLLFTNSFATVSIHPDLQRRLIVQVPNLISISRYLRCSKQHLTLYKVRHHAHPLRQPRLQIPVSNIVRYGLPPWIASPLPKPQAGGPPLVLCPKLFSIFVAILQDFKPSYLSSSGRRCMPLWQGST